MFELSTTCFFSEADLSQVLFGPSDYNNEKTCIIKLKKLFFSCVKLNYHKFFVNLWTSKCTKNFDINPFPKLFHILLFFYV